MYSGQGAQYFQMGQSLWEADPVFRSSFERYSEIVGPVGGRSLHEIIVSHPVSESGSFDRLAKTHPILVAFSLALTDAVSARGLRPDAVLGYSLGETAASVVSGVTDAESALKAVRAQAGVFERTAPPGRMIAVIADPSASLAALPPDCASVCEVAAVNTKGHGVLAIPEGVFDATMTALRAADIATFVLPVRFGFHSTQIEPSRDEFLAVAGLMPLKRPDMAFYSAKLGKPVADVTPEHYWQTARQTVRFDRVLDVLCRDPDVVLVDVGPSGTLAALARAHGGFARPPVALVNQFGRNVETVEEAVRSVLG